MRVCASIVVLLSALSTPLLAESPDSLSPQSISDFYAQSKSLSSPASGAKSNNVAVVVNSSLYSGGSIASGLSRYVADITRQGYNPVLVTDTFATAAALRTRLASLYGTTGLAGAVLIGDLPTATYEIAAHPDWPAESFPCDLYLQDLNGAWADADADGQLDGHTGSVTPEIWLGRLTAGPLTGLHSGRTESSLLNQYFDKNHAYRTGQLTASHNALAYVDDDWIPWANSWGGDLGSAVSGKLTIVQDGATTTAADLKARLTGNSVEHVLLAAHSAATYHSFKIGTNWTGGTLSASELAAMQPKALFYNLFCCSAARYTASGYIGGEYVFGTDDGLLAVGSAKTGSMLDFQYYFDPLGQGNTFGAAMRNWWNVEGANGYSADDKDWFYGMTLLGDPLLMTQDYMPEPVSLFLLVAGMGMLLRRRCR